MINLNGKVAIVTGGASGIGLATAKAFAEKGVKVLISDLNEEGGKAIELELKAEGKDVLFVRADVGNEEEVAQLVAEAVRTFGRLDIMFNNAGIGIMASTHELAFEDYNRVIKVNQDSVFFGIKHAVPEMKKVGGGSIVNTASILGHVGEPGAFAYNASKGAVNIATKSAAIEYAKDNIRVNTVCPGYVDSGMVNKEALGEFYDGLVARHPVGRLGTAEEIAHGVVFLCENEFVTGSSLMIDGGYTAQ